MLRSGSTVVVGLGPAGIIAARVLADAGVPILAFQPQPSAGTRHPLASPRPTIRDSPTARARRAPTPPAGADRLGGAKHLAAPQSYRLDPGAFASWPFTTADLAPFYERVERVVGTSSRPATAWTTRMLRAARSLGWHPFHAPAAASGDLSPLLHHPQIVVADATVTRVVTDTGGAVCGVEVMTAAGRHERLECARVIVATAVVPTVRLLLVSGITGGGMVGAGFLAHNAFTVHGVFPGVDLGRDTAGAASAVAVSDFENGRLRLPGGSIMQAAMTGPRTEAWRGGVAAGLPHAAVAPRRRAAWLAEREHSIGTVWAQPDQFAHPDNRIDLDPEHTDAVGSPVARLTLALHDDDDARWRALSGPMHTWLESAGATTTWGAPIAAQPLGTHLYGGAVMGTDPRRSVVDPFGRSHEIPGLWIVGSATFPSSGGRGPVETIEALAWRTAEHIATLT